MIDLATACRFQGRLDESERLLLECLDSCRGTVGGESRLAVSAVSALALTYHAQGRYTDAERSIGEAKRIQEKHTAEEGSGGSKSAKILDIAAWIIASGPDATSRAYEAISLAEQAIEFSPEEPRFENTLGVALYRAGKWEASLNTLNKSTGPRSGDDATAFFFTGMAHWQLGNQQEARQWYDKAVEWLEQHRPQDKELQRIRAEAAESLGVASPPEEVDQDDAPRGEP